MIPELASLSAACQILSNVCVNVVYMKTDFSVDWNTDLYNCNWHD